MKGVRGSRNKHTHADRDRYRAGPHAYCMTVTRAWGLCLVFAGELHVNSAVFIARTSEPVISKHLWASNNAGQIW
jgi:hypothetical protein